MRRQISLMLTLLALAGGARADDDGVDSSEAIVRRALEANPSLDSLRQRVEALESRSIQAGARPEPTVGLEYANVPVTAPALGIHPMSGLQLRLQQTLLAPGTVPRRVAVADARVEVGRAAYAEGRVALAAAVRRAYWELALTRQLRTLTVEHVAQVDRLIEAVRTSYEVGRAGQHDLLNLQLLRDRLRDDRQDHDRVERELSAALTAAVHAGESLRVPTPTQTAVPPVPEELAELVEAASSHNPSLARLDATASAEFAAADAAGREAWPDVTLWAGYRVRAPVVGIDDGRNQATIGLSVPLPTARTRRWGAREAEHEALAGAASSDAASALDAIRADLDAAVARWERAAAKASTYRGGLIPQARTTLDATLAAYQVGRADYASLFQAEVQLLDLERAARVAEAEAALAEVDVTMTLGTAERAEGRDGAPADPPEGEGR